MLKQQKPQRQDSEEYRKCCKFLLSRMAQRDDSQWPVARQYLIERSLDSQLIDQLYTDGQIYASKHRSNPSIVFPHRDLEGNVRGATLCTIRHQSSSTTSLGDTKNAWFNVGVELAKIHKAFVVTKSPIDALSYQQLNAVSDPYQGCIVSVGGTHIPEALIEYTVRNDKGLIVAFDHDPSGQMGFKIAESEMRRKSQIGRGACKAWIHCHPPPICANWNEELQAHCSSKKKVRSSLISEQQSQVRSRGMRL